MLLENTNLVAIQQNYRILNYLVKENNNTSPLFSRITNSLLLTKFLSTLYGSTLTLRLFGISFTAQYNPSELILKVGFSHTVNNFIPPNIIIRIKEDERKKPNILWFFSYDLITIKSYVNKIQKCRKISIFLRKRITGLLYFNELKTLKLKKWKDRKKKRK